MGIYFRRVDQLHIHSPRIAKSLATFIPYAPANPSAEKRFTRAPATVTDKMVSDRTSSSDGPERPRLKAEKNDTTKKQPSGSGGCFRSRCFRVESDPTSVSIYTTNGRATRSRAFPLTGHFLHDALLVIVSERPAQLVVVHGRSVLLQSPSSSHLRDTEHKITDTDEPARLLRRRRRAAATLIVGYHQTTGGVFMAAGVFHREKRSEQIRNATIS